MNFEIRNIEPSSLFGISMEMSLQNNTTPMLWKNFMQLRSQFISQIPGPLVSLQMYDQLEDVYAFDKNFVKWAGYFAKDTDRVPAVLQTLKIEGGAYAVFKYEGGPTQAAEFFKKVFTKVLPDAGLSLENRAHFEVLDANYRENFKEEIWIPVARTE